MKKPRQDCCAASRRADQSKLVAGGNYSARNGHRGTGFRVLTLLSIVLLLNVWNHGASGESRDGFELDDTLIPANEIFSGGPPRDGIPAIDAPKFLPAGKASGLRPEERVLGIARNGIAKAYPISILNLHEIVNDRFDGEAVVVTFRPLCGSGTAYSAKIHDVTFTFGVSGLLYNSDVLLYDRQTESLWSQLMAQAISGPMKGTRLHSLPVTHTTWRDWQTRHPDTRVPSTDTGHARDYSSNPYEDYVRSRSIWFPVSRISKRYHPKEQVLGIEINGRFKAFPFLELGKTSGTVLDRLAGQDLRIAFDSEHQSASAADSEGREMPAVVTFWLAWYAFHPETEVFVAEP